MAQQRAPASVDLYWLPLGAGGRVVRWCGRLYESWAAWREHRDRAALFHAGLMLRLDDTAFAVEMGPVWNVTEPDRGVLLEGPSARGGSAVSGLPATRCGAGRAATFPDLARRCDPVRTTHEPGTVAGRPGRAPAAAAAHTWGRDELGAGEMWNSNSAVAWHSRAPATTWTPSDRRPAAGRPGGRPASCWPGAAVDPGHRGAGAALTSRASRGESSRSSPARRRGPQAWHDGVGGLGETSRRARRRHRPAS